MEINKNMSQWHEDLPDKCPPEDASSPNGMILFRLCATSPPTESDFLSLRALSPTKYFKNVTECVAKALSCWDNQDKCLNIKKLPVHKDKFVMKLVLQPKDGLILKTFNNPSHYSWWRTKSFKLNSASIIA